MLQAGVQSDSTQHCPVASQTQLSAIDLCIKDVRSCKVIADFHHAKSAVLLTLASRVLAHAAYAVS
jgi:hypothetical protein